MLYRDCIGIIAPCSLLNTNKLRLRVGFGGSVPEVWGLGCRGLGFKASGLGVGLKFREWALRGSGPAFELKSQLLVSPL